MNREDKIARARAYAAELAVAYPSISAIILGGSLARGDDLPISDIDLLYFVPGDAPLLSIAKHQAGDVFIDIESQPAEILADPASLTDAYWLGYLADARVLYDRDGAAARCQQAALEARAAGLYRAQQEQALRYTVERNLSELAAAGEPLVVSEVCRAGIYALWTLIDLQLVRLCLSPGGARGLERLRARSPALADAIVAIECADPFAFEVEAGLGTLRAIMPVLSPFFQEWVDKVRWLFAHGYAPDGLHALWIALGLAIHYAQPEQGAVTQKAIDAACHRWLKLVGWGNNDRQARSSALRRFVLETLGDDRA